MKIAINYADDKFKKQQDYNTKTAYKKGKVDLVIEYSPKDLDDEFKKKYEHILSHKRGGGYWLWKPYIILKALDQAKDDDYIVYCDSGAFYVDKVDKLIQAMEKNNDDIMAFELPLIEKQWTKKEAFLLMDCNEESYFESNQMLATYFVVKKSEYTVEFINKYFDYCKDEKILTDFMDKENQNKCFVDHRHDQSIFSLLCKKEGIVPYRDPSQYGDRPWEYAAYDRLIRYKKYLNSDYPRIVMSQRKASLKNFILKEDIKDLLFKIGFVKHRSL
ncbi:hypothetical protein [Clostridium hydrogenum]|uniref:hypothetical protein n=1 Tax=Clostridium hydrogenum TaxID=2855764 RepID=UPI001F1BAAA7|nr:hypothetical protein [Clostridium hydrogenum]